MSQILNNIKTQAQSAGSGLKPYLIPAALGASVGGPLMAYFAGKNHVEGEDPKTRRHRILRNALLGLTLGGVAGGSIPAGLKSITNSARFQSGFHPLDTAASKVVLNPLPAAAGAAGGIFGYKQLEKNREQAAKRIHDLIGFSPQTSKLYGTKSTEQFTLPQVISRLRNPDSQEDTLTSLSQHLGDRYKARELAGEAGISIPADRSIGGVAQLREHLSSQGPISKIVSRLIPGAEGAAPKNTLGLRAAEMYSKYLRPSVNETLGDEGPRMGVLPMAGIIGGGMMGANYLQNKLEGN